MFTHPPYYSSTKGRGVLCKSFQRPKIAKMALRAKGIPAFGSFALFLFLNPYGYILAKNFRRFFHISQKISYICKMIVVL